jgi:hemolysin activation/secretion protein
VAALAVRKPNPSWAALLGAIVVLVAGASTPGLAQQATEPRMSVSGFRVEGDNPLAPEATQRLLAPFAGEQVTIDRLQAAAAALEEAIKASGHGFMRVVLPPQDATGTITLRVLAFRLGQVNLSGNKAFDNANVLRSLPSLRPGESPNLREIARNQAHVNDHPSKQVQVNMRQGRARDTVDADVRVEDSAPLHFFGSLNNSGAGTTGRWRLGLGVSHANLFDRDHAVTATWSTSPGHTSEVQQYGLYYRAPYYKLGGTLSAYYTRSDSDSGTVAEFFQVSGSGQFAGLRWTQRFAPIGAWSHAADIGLEDRLFDNNVTFNGTPIGVDVRSRPLLLRHEGSLAGAGFRVSHALELAHNLRGGRANSDAAYAGNRAGGERDWNAVRVTLQAAMDLSGWVASARLRGQWTADALIGGEQFGLGGAQGLRGLEEREGTGDRGHLATLELTTPPLAEGLRAIAFMDTGRAQLRAAGGAAAASAHATSFGFGVRWQWRRQLSVSVDAARVASAGGGLRTGDGRVHASLAVRF